MSNTLWYILVVAVGLIRAQQLRLLGQITADKPGLLNMFVADNPGTPQERHNVLIASYDHLTPGSIDFSYAWQRPGTSLGNLTGVVPSTVATPVFWPKEIAQVPTEVHGMPCVVSPDGSLVQLKLQGSVYVTDVSNWTAPVTHDLVNDGLLQDRFMYNKVLWKTMDAGRPIDAVTCRANFRNGTFGHTQFIWLEQPADGLGAEWPVHVLHENTCDMNLVETTLEIAPRDSFDVFFTTGFYTQKLAVYWTTNALGYWNTADLQVRWIETGRQYYDVQVADLNNDGKVELLVTVASNTNGSVEIFEIPDDFRTGQFIPHLISSGYRARAGGADGRAPGVARVFRPSTNHTGKPWILLAGADEGSAYYFRPVSEDAANWDYQREQIIFLPNLNQAPGVAVADVDNDGFTEVFVSEHQRNRVDVYTFAP